VAHEVRRQRYSEIPPSRRLLERAKPVYEELPGWHQDVTAARRFGELPVNAQRYLERIRDLCGARLSMVGVGAARDATIVLENPFAS
jgi:adenylosuccinate synthase